VEGEWCGCVSILRRHDAVLVQGGWGLAKLMDAVVSSIPADYQRCAGEAIGALRGLPFGDITKD
jgi:hypothetical protein